MELKNTMTNTSETPRTDEVPHNAAELAMFARKLERELMKEILPENQAPQLVDPTAMLDDLLWRLTDIRDDLMSRGLGGRLYNCDEWSTPTVNLAYAIKVIEKFKSNART